MSDLREVRDSELPLFLLEREFAAIYDEVVAFVVRAEDEEAARVLVANNKVAWSNRHYGSEGRSAWLNKAESTCKTIGRGPGEPAVLVTSMHHG